MKRWWTLWTISTRWDAEPRGRCTSTDRLDPRTADPQVRAWEQLHQALQQHRPAVPPPPADLHDQIRRAVRQQSGPRSTVRTPKLLQFLRPAVWIPAGLTAALAVALWLGHPSRPSKTALREPPHVWIGEAQLRAQAWARQVFEPDLARLQQEWDRTREEMRLVARHVLESVP